MSEISIRWPQEHAVAGIKIADTAALSSSESGLCPRTRGNKAHLYPKVYTEPKSGRRCATGQDIRPREEKSPLAPTSATRSVSQKRTAPFLFSASSSRPTCVDPALKPKQNRPCVASSMRGVDTASELADCAGLCSSNWLPPFKCQIRCPQGRSSANECASDLETRIGSCSANDFHITSGCHRRSQVGSRVQGRSVFGRSKCPLQALGRGHDAPTHDTPSFAVDELRSFQFTRADPETQAFP